MHLTFLLEAKGRKSVEYTIDNFKKVSGFYEDYTNSKVNQGDIVKIAQSRIPDEALSKDQQYNVVGLRKTDKDNEYIAINPIAHSTLSNRVWFMPARFVSKIDAPKQSGRKKFDFDISNYKNAEKFTDDLGNFQFKLDDIVKLSNSTYTNIKYPDNQTFKVLGGRILSSNKWIAIYPIAPETSNKVHFVNQYYLQLVEGNKHKLPPGRANKVHTKDDYNKLPRFTTDLTNFKFKMDDIVTVEYDERFVTTISVKGIPKDQKYKIVGAELTMGLNKYLALQPFNSTDTNVYFVLERFIRKDNTISDNRGRKAKQYTIDDYKTAPHFSEDMSGFKVVLRELVSTPYDREKDFFSNGLLSPAEQYTVLGGYQLPSGLRYVALQPTSDEHKNNVYFLPQNQLVKSNTTTRIDARGSSKPKTDIRNYQQVDGFVSDLSKYKLKFKVGDKVKVQYDHTTATTPVSHLPKEQQYTVLGAKNIKKQLEDKTITGDWFYALIPIDSVEPHYVYFVRSTFTRALDDNSTTRTLGNRSIVYTLKSYKYVENFSTDFTNFDIKLGDLVVTPYERATETQSIPNSDLSPDQLYTVLGYRKSQKNKILALNPVDENGQSISDRVYYIQSRLVKLASNQTLETRGVKETVYTLDNFKQVSGFIENLIDFAAELGDVVKTPYDRTKTKLANYKLPQDQLYEIVGARKSLQAYAFYAITPIEPENPIFDKRVYFIRVPYVVFTDKSRRKVRTTTMYNLDNYRTVPGFTDDMTGFKFNIGDHVITPKNTNLPTKDFAPDTKFRVLGGRKTSSDKRYIILAPIENVQNNYVYFVLDGYVKDPSTPIPNETPKVSNTLKHFTTDNYFKVSGFTKDLREFKFKTNDTVTTPTHDLPANQKFRILGGRFTLMGIKYIAINPIKPENTDLTNVVYFVPEHNLTKI